MTAFQIQHTAKSIQITLDKSFFSEEELLKMLTFIRVEYLAKKINFDKDIEILGDEIKKDWWTKNKHRFIEE
jgi:hypothetical protein